MKDPVSDLRSLCREGDLNGEGRWRPCGRCDLCKVADRLEEAIDKLTASNAHLKNALEKQTDRAMALDQLLGKANVKIQELEGRLR